MFVNSVWGATAIRCGMVLALVLLAGGCQQQPAQPHVTGGKKTKPIPCDTNVNVDLNGPDVDPIYLCTDDTVTWTPKAPTVTFDIDFHGVSPFADGVSQFDDKHAKHQGKPNYGKLAVYKYSITVRDQGIVKSVDPQVVAGGNP